MTGTVPGRFAGRVAAVTGAARGIGAASARRLATEGASVLLLDVADEHGARVAAQIRNAGGTARYVHCDVATESDWRAAREVVRTEFGGLDILHSNAFVQHAGAAHELDPAAWDRVLAVNLTALHLGVRAFVGDLRDRRGCIVVTSSVHALFGLPGSPAYAASKGGLAALTRQLAAEYGPQVRVNAVLPGPVDTDAWRGLGAEARKRAAAATVLGRLGDPAEVAAVVAFLASADASYVTGASLLVDGGWSVTKDSP
ncbi:SDR family NAD(P)-dependent oxidoreductase [Micromonospora sp. NPDC050200]|uniref:SDR family NAD(P)-dependent oxidoreductase n=1 Tax=Micromonospora sp. NPDC050200 TaxID=3155664 RepID=UPI00340A7DF0